MCDYVVRLVQATQPSPGSIGASPEAVSLIQGRSLGALEARDYVLPDDVSQLAVPILAHRLQLKADTVLRECRQQPWSVSSCTKLMWAWRERSHDTLWREITVLWRRCQ